MKEKEGLGKRQGDNKAFQVAGGMCPQHAGLSTEQSAPLDWREGLSER